MCSCNEDVITHCKNLLKDEYKYTVDDWEAGYYSGVRNVLEYLNKVNAERQRSEGVY